MDPGCALGCGMPGITAEVFDIMDSLTIFECYGCAMQTIKPQTVARTNRGEIGCNGHERMVLVSVVMMVMAS